ncbi:MAG: hypothetical protein ACFFCQ_17550 [Promethearchaeota archaeon]
MQPIKKVNISYQFFDHSHPRLKFANQAISEMTGGVVLQEIFPNSLFIELGKPSMLYCISKELKILLEKIPSSIRLESLGLCLGIYRGVRFDLSLESLWIINRYTKRFIMVDREGEQKFLYGHNLVTKRIIKKVGIENGTRCIIRNPDEEALGIGILKKSSKNGQLKNVQDLGCYLRKED